MKREDFTYSATKGGYMLYYMGRPIGGAGTMSGGKNLRGRAIQAQIKDYANSAKRDIDILLNGGYTSGVYAENIEEINKTPTIKQ